MSADLPVNVGLIAEVLAKVARGQRPEPSDGEIALRHFTRLIAATLRPAKQETKPIDWVQLAKIFDELDVLRAILNRRRRHDDAGNHAVAAKARECAEQALGRPLTRSQRTILLNLVRRKARPAEVTMYVLAWHLDLSLRRVKAMKIDRARLREVQQKLAVFTSL